MDPNCIFCQIVEGNIPAEKLYEDELIVAFRDINPVAPTHILLIPKEHIETLNDLTSQHEQVIGRIYTVAKELAAKAGLTGGYRIVVNCLADGGQEVYHLHYHLLGGRKLTWPPG